MHFRCCDDGAQSADRRTGPGGRRSRARPTSRLSVAGQRWRSRAAPFAGPWIETGLLASSWAHRHAAAVGEGGTNERRKSSPAAAGRQRRRHLRAGCLPGVSGPSSVMKVGRRPAKRALRGGDAARRGERHRAAPARRPAVANDFTANAASPGTVAPILYDSCVVCHRAGEMAPMALTTAKPYAEGAALGPEEITANDRSDRRGGRRSRARPTSRLSVAGQRWRSRGPIRRSMD